MGIKGHHIKATQDIENCLNNDIDFDTVDKKIESFRQTSREYLQKALTNRI
mgnify:CR=1 FL=1